MNEMITCECDGWDVCWSCVIKELMKRFKEK